jgi:flagellar motor switch protein FliM
VAAKSIHAAEVGSFNFSRAGLVANDQLRTLRTLDEQFARNLTHTLGAWLRTSVALQPKTATQTLFGQFMERTANGCYVLPLRMEPTGGRAALSVDLKLAPAVIDMLLGGSGRTNSTARELTEIEEAVLGSVLDIVLREWTSTWSPFGVEFSAGQRDRDSHGQRLMPLQEKTLLVEFTVSLGDITGELMFCMPSAPVASAMKAMSHTRERQRRTPDGRDRMVKRLGEATVKAQLHLPQMRLYAPDLRSLKAGSLLPLPLQRTAPAELRVGGVAVYRAQPVRSGEHRAARLVQFLNTPGNAGGEVA